MTKTEYKKAMADAKKEYLKWLKSPKTKQALKRATKEK